MNKNQHEAEKQKGACGDVVSADKKNSWFYSDIVKDHFFNPRNFLDCEPGDGEFNGLGKVGSPACGDEMRVWIFVDESSDRIKKFKWRTFGCGSAIAATSITSELVTSGDGMTTEEARNLKPQDIMEALGGLPARKFHCSVLSDKAMRQAINDFYRRTERFERIIPEASRIIDPIARVTDKYIEEAVLGGASELADVQAKTKVGIDNPSVLPAVEELLRFYKEKYFG
ncbi:iron-sulfur cluster assembly scaffold protein [Patescibacteria group bacterium]|nr:iron-sulfur cluster assembly scaffold protein [Patescibacteria group bacterium]